LSVSTQGAGDRFTKDKLRVNVVCPGGMPTAQATEFEAPENADWDLDHADRLTRGFMGDRRRCQVIRSWPATMPPPSTVRCTG